MSKPVPPESNRDLNARLMQISVEMNVSTLDLLRGAGHLALHSSSQGALDSFLSLIAGGGSDSGSTWVQVPLQPGRFDVSVQVEVIESGAES